VAAFYLRDLGTGFDNPKEQASRTGKLKLMRGNESGEKSIQTVETEVVQVSAERGEKRPPDRKDDCPGIRMRRDTVEGWGQTTINDGEMGNQGALNRKKSAWMGNSSKT